MKRIYMLSNHPLFSEGVATLLRQKAGMDLIGRESDVDRAIEQIRELCPDVVIVDTGNLTCDASSIMMRLFQEQLRAKTASPFGIVGLNLLSNTLCVYREEQRSVHQVEDLWQAIENDSSESELVRVAEKSTQERSEAQGSEGRTEN